MEVYIVKRYRYGSRRDRDAAKERDERAGETGEKGIRGQKSEIGSQRSEVLNIEPQNKKPQNDEVITSIFEIRCSTFCG